MRTVMVSVIGIGSIFLIVMIQQNINAETWEEEVIEESMTTAMEQTLSEVMEKNHYGIGDRNEMMAAFLQNMLYRMQEDVDLTVKIYQMDYELGQMDVELVGTYQRQKNTHRVSVRRKMVFSMSGNGSQ